jgi:hypothetical protein
LHNLKIMKSNYGNENDCLDYNTKLEAIGISKYGTFLTRYELISSMLSIIMKN